jgi:hypothetical protein
VVRDTDLTRLAAAVKDELPGRVAAWRGKHPDGTLEDAVRDLDLWKTPQDPDAQRPHGGEAAGRHLSAVRGWGRPVSAGWPYPEPPDNVPRQAAFEAANPDLEITCDQRRRWKASGRLADGSTACADSLDLGDLLDRLGAP